MRRSVKAAPHTCHARGCEKRVLPEMLMCAPHWLMVPRSIQRAVWLAYRPGQCDDMRPSKEWHRAADGAIGWVAMREGNPVTQREAAALIEFGYEKWLTPTGGRA